MREAPVQLDSPLEVGARFRELATLRVMSLERHRSPDVIFWLELADELTDGDVPWCEDDWNEECVAGARRAAAEHGLPFPPACGDLDRALQGEFGPAAAR